MQIWQQITDKANRVVKKEPVLATLVQECILSHDSFPKVICCIISRALATELVSQIELFNVFKNLMDDYQQNIVQAVEADIVALQKRDPACLDPLMPFLCFKGFQALVAHRFNHLLWQQDRLSLAFYLQGMASKVYGVDIHPAAKIGEGVMFDHATGIVIGETAVIENEVSILHGVTLGGTGHETDDRHPKVRRGVLIGAGAVLLGNIEVGEGAKVGAASLVLKDVEAHTTVAGVPARYICKNKRDNPALEMDQDFEA